MLRIQNPKRRKLTLLDDSRPFCVTDRVDASGNPFRTIRAYNGTGGALTAGRPYIIRFDGDEETNPTVSVVSFWSNVRSDLIGFPLTDLANATYGDFVIEGYATIKVDGTTDVSKDDYLKLAYKNSTTALVKDGSKPSLASCAIAREAQATNAATDTLCFILGELVAIDVT